MIEGSIAPAVSFGVLEPNTATLDMIAVYTAAGTKIVASERSLSSGVIAIGMTNKWPLNRGHFAVIKFAAQPTTQLEENVFSWFRSDKRRKNIREDRRFLEARARRLLEGYLAADDHHKKQYYEVVAGAAAACQPGISDPNVEDVLRARASAEAALRLSNCESSTPTGTIILRN